MTTCDMKRLRLLVGPRAYRALREGRAKLHVWRRSTPHNYWIESTRGEQLWHSSDYERPPMSLFELESESSEKIVPSILHRAGGLPESSVFVFVPSPPRRGI